MKSPRLAVSDRNNKKDKVEAAVKNSDRKVRLGDVIWVKLRGSTWWPAQVVDNMSVSQRIKPRKSSVREVLVRLYGTYNYKYVDPGTCRSEFEKVLKKNDGNSGAIFEKTLEKELARLRSGRAKENESELEGEVRSEDDEKNIKPIKISPKRLFPENTKNAKSEKLEMVNKKLKSSQPDVATADAGKSQGSIARRVKVMQSLGLVAPNGSPFHRKHPCT